MAVSRWEPPAELSRDDIQKVSDKVLAWPDVPSTVREDIFRINVVGLDWDIACEVTEPVDPARIPIGADGKKVGMFLLHGGMSDHRYMRPVAELLTKKFGCRVVSMSFPGRCYLLNKSHDWPGDTINPDGTVRTPMWAKDSVITPDQYELVQERSNLARRKKYGTLFLAMAKEGTEFYARMGGWPVAFEEGMKEACCRHFPVGEFSVYGHGRSTGGPFVNLLSQRVPNFAGIGAMENTPYGYIYRAMSGRNWDLPFNALTIRTWRDIARYKGPENGLEGAKRLPMLMEEIFEEWDREKTYSQFKAEGFIHFAELESLRQAAEATAKRLKLNEAGTQELVKRYQGYTRELSGPGVKPVPPLLLGVSEKSVDHNVTTYREVVLPMYAAMNPAPKVRLVYYAAGTHTYTDPEPGLPMGLGPVAVNLWIEAIKNGYYLDIDEVAD